MLHKIIFLLKRREETEEKKLCLTGFQQNFSTNPVFDEYLLLAVRTKYKFVFKKH